MQNFIEIKEKDAPAICTAILIFLTAIIIFSKINSNGLHYYDDAYYGQKAKEMMTYQHPMVAYFANGPTYDNPPMHFWIMAAAFKAFGVNEFSARLSSAVFFLLVMFLGYKMASFVFKDNWAGFFVVLVLALTNYIFRQSLRSMLDITLVFFEMMSLYLFMMAQDKKKFYLFVLAGVFTGFAVLTKSVMGLYPVVVIGLYFLFSGKPAKLFSFGFWTYLFSALIIFMPWYVYNHILAPDTFLQFHFGEIIGNAATGNTKSFKFNGDYFKVIFTYGLPWMPLAFYGTYEMIKREWKRGTDNLFIIILLWAWVIVGGLSFTSIIKTWYILPAFTACSIISGYLLYIWIKERQKAAKIIITLFTVVSLILVIFPININSRKSNEIKALAPFVKTLVPVGGSLINYKIPYWELLNPMIFYTDRVTTKTIEDPDVLMGELKKGGVAIAFTKNYEADFGKYKADIKEVAAAGDKIIFCSKVTMENTSGPVYFLKKP